MEHVYIVGLRNPGTEYDGTRHNVGDAVICELGNMLADIRWQQKSGVGDIAQSAIGETPVTLVRPNTYMNHSGKALSALGITTEMLSNVIVIHDDLDLPFGTVRIAFNRGSGGHRGIESIMNAFAGVKTFTRIRVGIARKTVFGRMKKPRGADAVATFVLAPFSAREKRELHNVTSRAALAARDVVARGHEAAMQEYNAS